MVALGEYLHDRGLKYGIYTDAGLLTCGGMAGSLGHEQQDMDLFLQFQIDYLKYDNCYPSVSNFKKYCIAQCLNYGLWGLKLYWAFLHSCSQLKSRPLQCG